MKIKVLLQNKQSGITKDYSSLCEKVEYTTNRTGSPGKLTLDIIAGASAHFVEGDPIQIAVDGTKIFAGYVFSKSQNRWGEMSVVAYDQLRYLLANASYNFTAFSMPQVISKIASDFQLNTGTLQDPGYIFPYLLKENKTCLDIISYANQVITKNTGKVHIFYDNAGALSYQEASTMMVPQVLGSKSLVTDFTYKSDIDTETYNRIKLVRPNQETGRTDAYVYESGPNIAAWGLLQYYEQVDEELNEAQITQQGVTMLAYYNRVLRTLSIESLGILGLRAGGMVMVKIPELSDISVSQFVLLDKVTHTFTNEDHIMKCETRTLIT